MQNELSYLNELPITAEVDKQKVFDLLLRQLQKDFGLFGIDFPVIPFSEAGFELLHKKTGSCLVKLEAQTGNQLMALLYNVDVSQNKYLQHLDKPSSERIPALANEVLSRTLKKVITKLYYS